MDLEAAEWNDAVLGAPLVETGVSSDLRRMLKYSPSIASRARFLLTSAQVARFKVSCTKSPKRVAWDVPTGQRCHFGFQQCFDYLTEVRHSGPCNAVDLSVLPKLLLTQSYFGA